MVLLKSLFITQQPHLISPEASHMLFKRKQKLCANVPKGPLNKLYVYTKNEWKYKNFKQCTMWNRISRRSKFPEKVKKFQRI